MAATNLNELFTGVADAIREKEGSTEAIAAADFPSRISALATGGGFNTEQYDVIKLNKVKYSYIGSVSNCYLWEGWDDYITDINNIEAMIFMHNTTTYYFVKNITGTFDENGIAALPAFAYSSNGAYHFASTTNYQFWISEDTGYAYFGKEGGEYISNSSYTTPFYIIMKKEA